MEAGSGLNKLQGEGKRTRLSSITAAGHCEEIVTGVVVRCTCTAVTTTEEQRRQAALPRQGINLDVTMEAGGCSAMQCVCVQGHVIVQGLRLFSASNLPSISEVVVALHR